MRLTVFLSYNLNYSNLRPDDEAEGDGGVDVTPGHVADGLGEAGHCDAEAESNPHDIGLGMVQGKW